MVPHLNPLLHGPVLFFAAAPGMKRNNRLGQSIEKLAGTVSILSRRVNSWSQVRNRKAEFLDRLRELETSWSVFFHLGWTSHNVLRAAAAQIPFENRSRIGEVAQDEIEAGKIS